MQTRQLLAVPLAVATLVAAGVVAHRTPVAAQAAPAAATSGHRAHGDPARAADPGRPAANPHAAHAWTVSPEQEAALLAVQAVPLRGSEFRADCASARRAGDDPIVKPGQPGASHIHEFYGNRSTDAHSTLASLAAGTTNCDPSVDLSAYWTPTLYQNGRAVAPEHVTVYYQGITDPRNAKPYPRGLRVVIGNALATSPDQNPAARWSCVGQSQSSRDFLACPPGSKLETYLDFPTCWDGVRLDSPDHHDHMAWGLGGVGGTCPASHPVPVPRMELLITYPVTGGGLSLAGTRNGVNTTTAPGYTFHGDFFNAWDAVQLQRRVTNCVNAGYVCGNDGNPILQ
ncbi:DUF1996 domain-containing protein [Longispora urticae]